MTTRTDHDVVVAGGRVAGAATARLLAAQGYDVVVLERATPYRDTLSTHGLSRGGVVQLARWGVLERLLAGGAPPIRAVTFVRPGEAVTRQVKDRAGVDLLLAPRRWALDALLADAAVEAGARLETGTTVTDLLRGPDGRVTGVRATAPGASMSTTRGWSSAPTGCAPRWPG